MREVVRRRPWPGSRPAPDALARCRLLAGAEPDALSRLAEASSCVRLPAASLLFEQGDATREVFLLDQGCVAFEHVLSDGRRISLGIAGPGMIVGDMELFDPTPRYSRARVVSDCVAVVMPAAGFLALCEQCERVSHALLRVYSKRLQYCMRMLRLKDDEQLLAHILLDYARRLSRATPQGLEIAVPLSQEELAAHVGTSRQRINRMLGDFRDRGWISTRYNTVTVHDPAVLRDVHAQSIPQRSTS